MLIQFFFTQVEDRLKKNNLRYVLFGDALHALQTIENVLRLFLVVCLVHVPYVVKYRLG